VELKEGLEYFDVITSSEIINNSKYFRPMDNLELIFEFYSSMESVNL